MTLRIVLISCDSHNQRQALDSLSPYTYTFLVFVYSSLQTVSFTFASTCYQYRKYTSIYNCWSAGEYQSPQLGMGGGGGVTRESRGMLIADSDLESHGTTCCYYWWSGNVLPAVSYGCWNSGSIQKKTFPLYKKEREWHSRRTRTLRLAPSMKH